MNPYEGLAFLDRISLTKLDFLPNPPAHHVEKGWLSVLSILDLRIGEAFVADKAAPRVMALVK